MRRNRSGLPQYCSWNKDRHGTRRVRFRKSGFSTYLTGTPYGDDFMRQYYGALEGVKTQSANIAAERTKPGSFDALCVAYYRSPEFLGLRDSTKHTYRGVIEKLRERIGKLPIRRLERRHIKKLLGEMEDRPQAANRVLSLLKILLDVAMDLGMIANNPARGVKGFRKKTEGFHSWTEEEIEQFIEKHPAGTKAYLALTLLLYTAQRRSDVVNMGWQHISGDNLRVTQQKTGTTLLIPLHGILQHALSQTPKTNMTFLVTEFGKPFSVAGFGNWFRDRAKEAGLSNCSPHGLRKAAARRLAEAGCSADVIKALTGHQSLKELTIYTAAADQQRLATQAIGSLKAQDENR
ncbi:Tyrosine recombinase XerC [Pseudovibrio sp. W64]|uniref:site-specific integrase n=1 Tax=Pseudovibrio sp. W64 TaxID=1735583 RepID=UPI0007AE908B|nr:tyrosine-type recombinase/integrase [Pseudovibrio sp. W64]KZK75372.1 Tyrosine recombinase XerC [Pseudovibrio sp. W64]